MRVHKKDSSFKPEKLSNNILSDGNDYQTIFENIKTYVVFKISITSSLKERLAYLDVFDYMEQIHTEIKKN